MTLPKIVYIVIARDKETGNEWVMPDTAETVVEIGEHLDRYRANDPRFEYRLDAVAPAKDRKQMLKDFLNTPVYADTDSLHVQEVRTEDFQTTELFGWFDGTEAGPRIINCLECGATVSYDNKMMEVHRKWHNKLLP